MSNGWKSEFDDVYEELFLYGLVRKDTLRDHVRNLYPFLTETASKGELVNYGRTRSKIDTSRQYLGRVLGAINECEYRRGEPMLTAVVVQDEKIDGQRLPSPGFFTWPCVKDDSPEVWLHPDKTRSVDARQQRYWEDKRDEVWATWA